jgi:NifU-like protein involved in Fe-S cluster formation
MTATCREPCCAPPTLSVSDLFERGFRRSRETPLALQGEAQTNAEGHFARFSLELTGDRIADLRFQASPCATLIAYCELIAETLPGARLDIAGALTGADLVEKLPGVPAIKRDRAALAAAALQSALSIPSLPHSGARDESRLHLRYPAA